MSGRVTSWPETSQPLTRRSFQFNQLKSRLWIHSNASCWKRLTRRSKTVGSAYRACSDEYIQLILDKTQRVFHWIQLLDQKHAYMLALPHETTKPCCSGIQSLQRNTLVLALAPLFSLTESAGSTTLEVLVSHLTQHVPAV